jgi:hypothetical protein
MLCGGLLHETLLLYPEDRSMLHLVGKDGAPLFVTDLDRYVVIMSPTYLQRSYFCGEFKQDYAKLLSSCAVA